MDIPVSSLETLFGALEPQALDELRGASELVQLKRGEVLYAEGEEASGMHIVLSGRLQVSLRGDSNQERVVAAIPPGQSVGETALFTESPRSATVIATRDTALAHIRRDAFDRVMRHYPATALHLSRQVIRRLSVSQASRSSVPAPRNLAIVPLHADFPIDDLSRRLQAALAVHRRTGLLDTAVVAAMMAGKGPSAADDLALAQLLERHDSDFDCVLYQADASATEWTNRCLGSADKILLVARASDVGRRSPMVDLVLSDPSLGCVEKVLVLVHPDDQSAPNNTSDWLQLVRPDRHYHVPLAGGRGLNRLARLLSNRAVTLALGGGGARGLAHIGVVRALRELGVPVDAAGGTSFGALIAALVALGLDDDRLFAITKVAFTGQSLTDDYTLPLISVVRGNKMRRALLQYFGEGSIEDLWLPFLAVSSNLTRNRKCVHTRGQLWRALRASVSLPAVFPPLIENGELLIDGALLDNLPVDELRTLVPGTSIAVDLSVDDEFRIERDHMPTAFEILKSKLMPWRSRLNAPTLDRIIAKATMLGSKSEAANARRLAHLYLNPPLAGFDLLSWHRFHELVDLGHRYAKPVIAEWLEANPGLVPFEK